MSHSAKVQLTDVFLLIFQSSFAKRIYLDVFFKNNKNMDYKQTL